MAGAGGVVMTVLVTGGCGYVGAHVVLELQAKGERVVVVDDFSTGLPGAAPEPVEIHAGDVAAPGVVAAAVGAHQVDAILHLAARADVAESVRHPEDTYRRNVAGTLAVAAVAAARQIPVVFASSAAVYGAYAGSEPAAEWLPVLPLSPYGRSKGWGEQLLADAAQAHTGFRWAALRLFNVAGADFYRRAGQTAGGHLFRAAARVALGREPALKIYGRDYPTPDRTAIRDFVHVSDVAGAFVVALEWLRSGADSFVANVGSGVGASVLEVARAFRTRDMAPLPIEFAERRVGDPARAVANIGFMRDDLGWTPRCSDLGFLAWSAVEFERWGRGGLAPQTKEVTSAR